MSCGAGFHGDRRFIHLRGGRLTKWRGKVASIAPVLAVVAPVLMDAPTVQAGSCLSSAPNSYTCSGAANPVTDTTQSVSFSVNDIASVGIADGFGHDTRTNGGTAIEISADANTQGLYTHFDGAATIDGANHALDISFAGANAPGSLTVGQSNSLQTVTLTSHGASHAALNIVTTTATQIVSVGLPNSDLTGRYEGVHVQHNGKSLVIVDVNNVTGQSGDAIDIDKSGPGFASIRTTGIVDGAHSGINVLHSGQGDIVIDAQGTVISRGTGVSYAGIYAELSSNDGGNIDASASGNIEAKSTGIFLVNKGKGKTTFTLGDTTANTFANITGIGGGTARTAANAVHIATGATAGTSITGNFAVEVTTVAGGKLQAGSGGIDINHGGDKGVMVVSNAAIDAAGKGIDIDMRFGANPGKLDVDVGGTITAGNWGVYALTAGGNATIDITAQIDAGSSGTGGGVGLIHSGSGDASITSSTQVVAQGTGADSVGLGIRHYGTGNATITANGTVSAKEEGVAIEHRGNGNAIITANAAINADGSGIDVMHTGTGTVTVTTNAGGTVTSTNDDAISIDAGASVTAVNVTTDDTLTSNNGDAIYISYSGTGNATVHAKETITSNANGSGVYLDHSSGNGNDSITTDANVLAAENGLAIIKGGNGTATIIANSDVISGNYGLLIKHSAAGDATITAYGKAQTTGVAAKDGILVEHTGTTGDISITAKDVVDAQWVGISVKAKNKTGAGSVQVVAEKDVSGHSHGIFVETGSATTTTTIAARGDISFKPSSWALFDGIHVTHKGTGPVQIAADGDISARDDGVEVITSASSSTVDITISGTVNAELGEGVFVDQYGNGNATITANNTVDGGQSGIKITHAGTGNATITANGVVLGNGTASTDVAIGIRHTGTGEITIAANGPLVGAENRGISARHEGTGGIDIDSTAKIVAKGSDADDAGIRAMLTTNNGTSIDVLARGDIEAKNIGVYLVNDGKGKTTLKLDSGKSITGIGASTATADDAIRATTDASAGTSIVGDYAVDITTTTGGTLEAGRYGIYVSHAGQKGVKITSGAGIDSTSRGINVSMTNTAAGKLDITTSGTINAGEWGVFAVTSGTGAATITTNAAVTGAAGGVGLKLLGSSGDSSVTVNSSITANGAPNVGVYTYRQSGTGNVNITANAQVDAAGDGVRAYHGGSGDIGIDVNAKVISRGTTAGYGAIRAQMASASGGNVEVSATADIEAAGYGMHVINNGQGQTTITLGSATGANSITGIGGAGNATRDDAIYVQTGTSAGTSVAGDYAVDVQVNTAGSAGGVLEAGQDGIDINHAGKKGVRVASTTQIKAGQDGINIDMTSASAGKLDITSGGAITTGGWGIYAQTKGNGTATINVNAQIDAGSGGSGGGVGLIHSGTGDATITANAAITAQGTGADDVGLGIRHTGTGNVTITANANVTANQDAIGIDHQGNGTVTVNTGASATLTSIGSDAISIDAGAGVTSVSVTAQGALNATGGDGTHVEYDGTGNATVHTKSTVTTITSGDGVSITHDANGNDTIIADAQVNAAESGLAATKNAGSGDIDITANADITANGTGMDDAALYAKHAGTGDIGITANKKVDAQNIGIFAEHGGTGNISIDFGANASIVARGTDATDAAIVARLTTDNGGNINIAPNNAVPIQAKNIGLLLVNNGKGYVNVNLKGGITGIGGTGNKTADDAIHVATDASAGATTIPTTTTAVSVVTAALESQAEGIDISHGGRGDVEVETFGDITAGGMGIKVAMTNANAGDASISQYGAITAGNHGIYLKNDGKGSSIIRHGQPGATIIAGKDAIHLETAATTTANISTSNPLTAGEDGIDATHAGTGDLTINVGNTITADESGIKAVHSGSAGIDIDTTSKIVAKGANATDTAIHAKLSTDNGTNIDVLVKGDIEAKNIGVHLVNNGKGKTTFKLDSGKSITGIGGAGNKAADDAIHVEADASAGMQLAAGQTVAVDITTTSGGTLEAGEDGIDIDHAGKGDVKLTSAAQIKADRDGIHVAMTNTDAGSLTITSSAQLTADRSGIHAETSGKGNADVTVTGDVIASGNGSTAARGVGIEHKGDTGNTTLRVDGTVTFNGADAGEVAVVAARASGTSGNVDMTLKGTVDSKSTGVAAYTLLTGTGNITITQNAGATIKAGNTGILVGHIAKGDVQVVSNAQVQADGTRPDKDYGIGVGHAGDTGNIDVQVKGGVIFNSTDSNEAAVYASRSSGSTGNVAITIDSAITSRTHGVGASNTVSGNGAITITQNAAITAGNHGIVADHSATGDITINSMAQITADGSGIVASHIGRGVIDIDTTSKIVAKGANATDGGILAGLSTNGTDIDVLARGDIEAKNIGVYLVNDGKGKTTFKLDSGKSITGIGGTGNKTASDAIRVETDTTVGSNVAGDYAVDITITAGGVLEAGKDGIDIDHAGKKGVKLTSATEIKAGQDGINIDVTSASAGKLTIDSDARITATGGHGIAATTSGTDATIDVNQQITAGKSGVRLTHSGSTGAASITTSAPITAAKEGIVLSVNGSAADATITTTASVQGGKNAIFAAHNGGGNLNITTSADITGGTSYAIYAATQVGKTTTLNVNGGTVSATSGIAILNNDGDSTINLAATSTVKGQIKLGDGSDVLNVNNADASGVTLFDGGDDTSTADGYIDKLNFDNITLNNFGAGKVKNWEQFNLNNGSSVHFTSGTMHVGEVVVAASSQFSFAGSSVTVTGKMNNQGTITAQNNANGDLLTINGDYAGNGTVMLDVKLDDGTVDTTDKLVIKGDNNGTILVDVKNVGGTGGNTGTGPTDGIQIVDIQGTNNGSLQLAGGQIIVDIYTYTLTNDGYLQSTPVVTDAMTTAPAMAFFLPGGMESLWQRLGTIWTMAPTASGSVRTAGFTITPTAATPLDLTSGFWLRGSYRYMKADVNASAGATPFNPTSKLHQLRAELGYTQLLAETAAGRLSGSIFTHYRRTSTDVENNGSKRGTARADGFGGGTSLTWIGAEGFYGDFLAELDRHRVTFDDNVFNATGKTWATTWRVSLEGGYRVPVNDRISLVPQAQINVRDSKFKRYSVGAFTYEDHTKPVVTGRIGIGAQMARMAVAENLDVTAQLTASLLHDFGKGGYMSANNQKIKADFASTLVQLRSNLTALVPGSGLSFSLENSFSHSLKGPKQYEFSTSLGLNINF